MKKKITVSALITILLVIVTTGILVSIPRTPPPSKSGAPDEGTCADCHTGAGLNMGPGNVSLSFSGANNQYKVDKFYVVTVTVTDTTKSRFGFQVLSLDENLLMAGKIKITDTAHTRTQKDKNGLGRKYINNYTTNYLPINVWTYKWKSETNVGPVTFYASGNATDGMDTETNDNVYTTQMIVIPKGVRESDEVISQVENTLRIFPNPATSGHFNISFGIHGGEEILVTADLLNTKGQFVQRLFTAIKEKGSHEQTIYLKNHLTPGIYLVALKAGEQLEYQKLIIGM